MGNSFGFHLDRALMDSAKMIYFFQRIHGLHALSLRSPSEEIPGQLNAYRQGIERMLRRYPKSPYMKKLQADCDAFAECYSF